MSRSTDRPVPSPSSERSPVALAEVRGRFRPQRSFLRRFSLHCLSPLMLVVNTADAGIFTYGGLVGTSHHATAVTSLYRYILLVLSVVPANLLRIKRLSGVGLLWASVRFLAGLRKPLGISAGVWFAAHTVVGLMEYFDLFSGLLRQFLIGTYSWAWSRWSYLRRCCLRLTTPQWRRGCPRRAVRRMHRSVHRSSHV